VLHQLKRPGAPFIFGAGMSNLDMSSVQPTYSSPEAVISQAGLCSLGRYYNLPTWGFAGCSSSKVPDEQAVYEATMYNLMAGLMGSNLNHDVGYLEFGLTYSLEALVMCDEQIRYIRRMMEGIRIDREYLAKEAIQRVGPGGNFLSDEHTFNHFRENFIGDITDRRTYEQWQRAGATTMRERARMKIKKILADHQPLPLAAPAEEAIEGILKAAEERHPEAKSASPR
jgi:trimethylamine--corrinoid protein Co-methyltransferase